MAAGTGIEKVLASRILKNAGARTTGALAATKAAAFTGAKEAVPEFIQAAQEQMAGNIALQREGFEDIPTFRGVASAAALEGSVGFLLGAGIGGIDAAVSPEQRSQYDAARANITNEVDRERELALRFEEDNNARRFIESLQADNARRAQGQAEQVNLDAEAANARAAASNIAPPTQDEVNQLATPFKGADVSSDVQFGVSYGQKIARELGDYFPNFGQFSVREGEVQGDATYGPDGTAISLGTPTFEVIDSEGKRYGQPLQSFEQANATAFSLNKEVVNQNVRGAIRNSLDVSAQPYDPDTTQRLFAYGYRTLNPEANTFSAVSINEAAKTTGPEYAEALSWRQVEELPQAKDRRGRVIGYQYVPQGQPPRIIKGLTKAQEINKARSQEGKPESNVFSLQETKSALGKSFPAITKDVPIDPAIGKKGAINQIRDLIRSKNITSDIASPEVNALAKGLTGKSSVQDMDYGDIRLFYKKLSSLPRFERETQLPVFEFKPYNRENFVRASKFIQTANAQGQKPTRDQIIEAAGLSKEDPKVDEKVSALEADLSKQGVKNTAQEPLALPAPPGQAIDLEALRDALRAKLKGFGLNDVQLSLERNLIKPTGEIASEESEGFFLPAMRQIFLAVDRVDPDGSLTPEQRLNALAEVMDHEVIHAARLLDLWTESEWSTLERAASRTQKPGTGQTYLEIAQQNYPDQNAVVQMEEAVAEMFRDYSAKRLKIAGKPQNLLERLAQFFQRLRSALTGTGFQTYSDVFNRLQAGEIGARQRGEVRTLRATEETVAQAGRVPERLQGVLAPTQAAAVTGTGAVREARRESTPIESALELARRNHAEYSTSSEEEFFGRFWPTLLSSVRGTVAPTNSGIRTAAKRAIRDMDQWLKDNPKFRDYYNNDMSATKQVLDSAYGPITDEEFLYYRIANGLTSPATKLPSNVGDALLVFDLWKRNGNLDEIKMGLSDKGNIVIQESPISISGTTGANKARSLKIIDRLTQEKGSLTNAIEFLKEGVPVKDLHAFNREMGYKGNVSDIGAIQDLVEMATGQRDLIPRMFIFGKKVGAYTLNMAGDSRYNTIDVWESRFIRSYFNGLFSERTGLPEVVSEDKLFQDFTKLFKEEYEKLTNQQWDNSALQAMRWFYIINAARQAGYRGASTNETISEYTRRGIESPRTSRPYRRGESDAETIAAGPVIRESRVGPQRAGDRGGRGQGRTIAPLEGSPDVQGGGPIPEIVSVAERYAAANGIPYERQSTYVDVDPDRAKRIADAFEAMQHNPTDPEVVAAYQDLIRQTRAQYDALVDDGFLFTFFDSETDPYASNPWNAMRDLRNNKRLAVFGTYAGYGTEGITDSEIANNPLLEDTGLRWPDQNGVERMVTANDLFRAVHDAFGHGIEGSGFRARGEENAWQAHARMFTGPALAALTTETRGQNSWLNYGPYAERNRTAKTEDTVFAEQKIGLLPEWTWQEGIERVPAPVIREARRAPPRQVPAGPTQPGPAVNTDSTATAEALNEGQPVNSMGVPIGEVIGDTTPEGTVDISRARIAPITRRLVSQLIQSAPEKLRSGFGLDDLANRVENYYDGYAAKLGIVNNLIRNAYKNIGLGGRDAAMGTFERYIRARENKKPNEAMAILNNASASDRQLIDAWNQISAETGRINKAVRTPEGEPMKVYDSKLNNGKGGWRPIGTVNDFFPRTLRREVMEVMKNPDLDPQLWQSLLDSLVKSGREDIKTLADAEKYLIREWFSDEIKSDYFAGVEKARTEPLPEIFYDYSWDAATRYLNKWARRTSQIENFGQELGQFKKEWFGANLPKIRDQETQNYLNTIRERIYEIEPFDTLSNMANWLNSLATATQLGNPISASLNLFGGTIANIQEFGIRAVAKSYLDLLTDWRKIQEEGTSLGILNKDFMNILRDHVEMDADKYFSKEQRISQSLARFANTALTFGGFNAAENVVRSSAMLAARARLNTFLKKVNDNPNSANVKKFNAWAKRENLNVDALILENGSGRETEKYMRRAVNIPQGSYQIDMTPVFIDTTAGRFFFKYQKFGTQINRFYYNHFLKPILTEKERRGRNILRALGFVGTAVVGGGAILAIREAFGYGDPGPDLDELDKALENEDTARAWALILSRSMENIMAAGSFGFFANYAQFAKDWQDQQRVKNPMSPPGLASIDAVIDVFNRLRDQKTLTARDLDEIAETTMSFYRANKRIALAAMDEMGSDAKEVERFSAFKDLREVREYGRRFSDEMGIEFKRSTAPGSPIRTEMTPVNKAITDALHVGDAAAARIIMREAIMGVPPKERQRIRQSIQSSVRNRQPLQIGGNAPSKEERLLFMRWAKQNLPKEKVDLILQADREYRRAAARIGMAIN